MITWVEDNVWNMLAGAAIFVFLILPMVLYAI